MTASNFDAASLGPENLRSASADPPRKNSPANCGPMCQQSPLGAHGHDMHPQEFVRLIGCSDTGKQKADNIERLH